MAYSATYSWFRFRWKLRLHGICGCQCHADGENLGLHVLCSFGKKLYFLVTQSGAIAQLGDLA